MASTYSFIANKPLCSMSLELQLKNGFLWLTILPTCTSTTLIWATLQVHFDGIQTTCVAEYNNERSATNVWVAKVEPLNHKEQSGRYFLLYVHKHNVCKTLSHCKSRSFSCIHNKTDTTILKDSTVAHSVHRKQNCQAIKRSDIEDDMWKIQASHQLGFPFSKLSRNLITNKITCTKTALPI